MVFSPGSVQRGFTQALQHVWLARGTRCVSLQGRKQGPQMRCDAGSSGPVHCQLAPKLGDISEIRISDDCQFEGCTTAVQMLVHLAEVGQKCSTRGNMNWHEVTDVNSIIDVLMPLNFSVFSGRPGQIVGLIPRLLRYHRDAHALYVGIVAQELPDELQCCFCMPLAVGDGEERGSRSPDDRSDERCTETDFALFIVELASLQGCLRLLEYNRHARLGSGLSV